MQQTLENKLTKLWTPRPSRIIQTRAAGKISDWYPEKYGFLDSSNCVAAARGSEIFIDDFEIRNYTKLRACREIWKYNPQARASYPDIKGMWAVFDVALYDDSTFAALNATIMHDEKDRLITEDKNDGTVREYDNFTGNGMIEQKDSATIPFNSKDARYKIDGRMNKGDIVNYKTLIDHNGPRAVEILTLAKKGTQNAAFLTDFLRNNRYANTGLHRTRNYS